MKSHHEAVYAELKRTIDKLEASQSNVTSNLKNIFNHNQINILTERYKKIPQWCNDSLVKGFQLRVACGVGVMNS